MTTQFVKYLAKHIAVRTINENTDATALYLAAAYGGNTMNFALNNGLYVGTRGRQGRSFRQMTSLFQAKTVVLCICPMGSLERFTFRLNPSLIRPHPTRMRLERRAFLPLS